MRYLALLLVMCALPLGCGGDDTLPDPPGLDAAVVDAGTPKADTQPLTPDEGAATPDTGAPPPALSDPIVRVASLPLATWPQGGGALAAAGSVVAACDGETVVVAPAALDAPGVISPLGAACRAVATDGETTWVSAADGQWRAITDAKTTTTAGPAAHGLTLVGEHVVGALGAAGLGVAPGELTTEATVSAVAADARAVASVGDRLVVADGMAGVTTALLGADGALSKLGNTPILGISVGVAALGDAHAVLAVGAVGLIVVEVSGSAPAIVGQATFNPKGMAMDVAVSADGGLALVADWDRVRLVDLSDPTAPEVIAREVLAGGPTAGHRALGVEPTGDGFVVQGLDHLTRLAVEPSVVVGEIAIQPGATWLPAGPDGTAAAVLVINTGRAPLELSGIETATERIAWQSPAIPESGALTIAPGMFEVVELSVAGDAPLSTTVRFETTDPDGFGEELSVEINPQILGLGDPAPDFLTPTLDGRVAQLSDYAGKVLYLRMFNAMCESCLEVLPIIETDFWLEYGDQGLQTLAIHIGDALLTAVDFQHKTQITFPMMLDFGREVLRLYSRVGDSSYLFPLAYVVGVDGTVEAIYQDVEPTFDDMKATIEGLLKGP